MKIVIQRSKEASVTVDGKIVGEIERGIVILLGVGPEDGQAEVDWLAEKSVNLRIFADQDGKMNRSLLDISGEVLLISQFTLYGDCQKGRRPSFTKAGHPSIAEPLVEEFAKKLVSLGINNVATGIFGADMKVSLVNDGPVTLVIEK
jgi:D-tyrosyl-tRNA(Tyr) deacylase